MTRTFERFLRSFSDEDLVRFAEQRGRRQPPYWRVMSTALKIEASRRGIQLEAPAEGTTAPSGARTRSGRATA